MSDKSKQYLDSNTDDFIKDILKTLEDRKYLISIADDKGIFITNCTLGLTDLAFVLKVNDIYFNEKITAIRERRLEKALIDTTDTEGE